LGRPDDCLGTTFYEKGDGQFSQRPYHTYLALTSTENQNLVTPAVKEYCEQRIRRAREAMEFLAPQGSAVAPLAPQQEPAAQASVAAVAPSEPQQGTAAHAAAAPSEPQSIIPPVPKSFNLPLAKVASEWRAVRDEIVKHKKHQEKCKEKLDYRVTCSKQGRSPLLQWLRVFPIDWNEKGDLDNEGPIGEYKHFHLRSIQATELYKTLVKKNEEPEDEDYDEDEDWEN
jgi:hypothetical protein